MNKLRIQFIQLKVKVQLSRFWSMEKQLQNRLDTSI